MRSGGCGGDAHHFVREPLSYILLLGGGSCSAQEPGSTSNGGYFKAGCDFCGLEKHATAWGTLSRER